MHHGTLYRRGNNIFAAATSVLRESVQAPGVSDTVGIRFLVSIAVWGHWVGLATMWFEISHHIGDETAKYSTYALVVLTLMAFNGVLHYRLQFKKTMSWGWLQALYGMDIVAISYWLVTSGGFAHPFIHVFYFVVLAALAVFLSPFQRNMAVVTVVAATYVGIVLTVGDGIDIGENDHETILARVAAMFLVAVTVNVAARFEWVRFRQAMERERALEGERTELAWALQHERIELSQTIHDTAAQSAYMIGLGLDTAKALAGDANPKLSATLEETARLSRSAMWELRHPITVGSIYEGRELGSALRSHAASFTNITDIPAEVTLTGVEPALSAETSSQLFSIAHNALTNAYRHAEATRVAINLDFSGEDIRLSVSDDGAGLPDDYAESGHGFKNMASAAERLGGRLEVEQRGSIGGASVTCVVPPVHEAEGGRNGIG